MKIHIENKLYACGDIHGDTNELTYEIIKRDLKDCTIILLGDVGIFRYRDYKRYKYLDTTCSERNITVYALRGNHDNPGFFNDLTNPIIKRFWEKFTNFKPLKDLTILLTSNRNKILTLPGAISRDRCTRKNWRRTYVHEYDYYRGGDWWPKEIIPQLPEDLGEFDAILSHNGPIPCRGIITIPDSFKAQDEAVESDIAQEQKYLHNIQVKLKPKVWWFGHYHNQYDYESNNTKYRILAISELSEFNI